ncbi:hypothetical protein [Neorhizobium galegae]|uniref:hypothetical protein n=1 Tax=Neorhizobium galegae TaxID=399 RepID=UPI001F3BBBD9|nr:hypothetical protein [Neorhizobium galegae]UIK05002.1 hypothetical protein LZK81_20495 [Neorhizobium galegae]
MKVIVFCAMMAAATAASAADIEIDVQNFSVERGVARAVMLVKNNLAKPVQGVFIDCAFLDGDKKAVGIGRAIINALAPNGDAYEEAALPTKASVQFVDCRVRSFRD